MPGPDLEWRIERGVRELSGHEFGGFRAFRQAIQFRADNDAAAQQGDAQQKPSLFDARLHDHFLYSEQDAQVLVPIIIGSGPVVCT